GLDGIRMATHVAFSEPATELGPVDPEVAGSANAGWVRLAWTWDLASGESRDLRWVVWMSSRPTRSARAHDGTSEAPDVLFPPVPRLDTDAVAASYHAWNRSLAAIRTDNE